jgi:DNA-binding response OmpR family regulator
MKTILIVDDDKSISLGLAPFLKKAGYQVECAFDGITGLGSAVRGRPDLIILDVCMPAGGGIGLAQRVQSLPSLVGTAIICISATDKFDLKAMLQLLGVSTFFKKPVDHEALLAAIHQLLGEESAPPPKSTAHAPLPPEQHQPKEKSK